MKVRAAAVEWDGMSLDGLRSIEELGGRRNHGDRLRYKAGCRCLPCRAANSNYETERAALRRAGYSNRVVPAYPARRLIAKLQAAGVGTRQIAEVSGVARCIVLGISTGRRRRCREETIRAIRGVRPSAAADGAYVDATDTWNLIDELVASGWPKARIAYAIGKERGALQIGRSRCSKRNADLIEALHRRVTAA